MNKTYSTSDINKAIALHSCGVTVNKIFAEDKRVVFCFEDQDRCKKLVESYLNGSLVVNVKRFLESQDMLKGEMRDCLDQKNY